MLKLVEETNKKIQNEKKENEKKKENLNSAVTNIKNRVPEKTEAEILKELNDWGVQPVSDGRIKIYSDGQYLFSVNDYDNALNAFWALSGSEGLGMTSGGSLSLQEIVHTKGPGNFSLDFTGGAISLEVQAVLTGEAMKQQNANNKLQEIKNLNKPVITMDPEVADHIRYRDESVPRRRGIGGSHNEQEFLKNDVKIVSLKSTGVEGVKVIEYNMPKLNKEGPSTGEYGITTFKKTIYDPKIISDEMFVKRGIEAANESLMRNGTLTREWRGADSQGKFWRGYYENGIVTSFFPE